MDNATDPRVRILYATMTGNTREAVELLVERLEAQGRAVRVDEMAACPPAQLGAGGTVLFLTSTFGNGDPPDAAFSFWAALKRAAHLDLSSLRYAVLALGDSAYPRFCQFGVDLDARLEELGAQRLLPVARCDVDWEEPFDAWCQALLER